MSEKEDDDVETGAPDTEAMVDQPTGSEQTPVEISLKRKCFEGKNAISLSDEEAHKEASTEHSWLGKHAPVIAKGDNWDSTNQGKAFGKGASFWDSTFSHSTHNRAHNLLDVDLIELSKYSAVDLSIGLQNYLNKATALAYMSEMKAKEARANKRSKKETDCELERLKAEIIELKDANAKANEKLLKAEAEIQAEKEAMTIAKDEYASALNTWEEEKKELLDYEVTLKTEVAKSFQNGFQAALEQARVIAPSIDFSTANPWKFVLNGAIIT